MLVHPLFGTLTIISMSPSSSLMDLTLVHLILDSPSADEIKICSIYPTTHYQSSHTIIWWSIIYRPWRLVVCLCVPMALILPDFDTSNPWRHNLFSPVPHFRYNGHIPSAWWKRLFFTSSRLIIWSITSFEDIACHSLLVATSLCSKLISYPQALFQADEVGSSQFKWALIIEASCSVTSLL